MKLTLKIKLFILPIFFGISACYAQGSQLENLEQLSNNVKKYLQQQYISSNIPPVIAINQLDNRLRLKKCSIPPQHSLKSGQKKYGYVTVFVECKGEAPWSLYVPATVTGYENVVIAKQGIFRGTVITKQHLTIKKTDLSKAYYGYFTSKEPVIGMQASRSIPARSIINKLFLELPDIIKEGQEIFIQAKTHGINVQLKGKALSDGKLGQLIRVKNKSSGKIIQAKVISSTKVEVYVD